MTVKMMVPLIEGDLEGLGRTDDRLSLECTRFVKQPVVKRQQMRRKYGSRDVIRGNNRSSAGCIHKLVTP